MHHEHFLSPLFDPRRVALITGPDGAPAWAGPLMMGLASAPERVTVMPLGKSVRSPPAEMDLAVIATDPSVGDEALALAARLHVRFAVMLCDTPSDAHTQRWRRYAAQRSIRLLGPGSAGFVRPPLGLNLGCMGPLPQPGDVAIVSQSGALGSALLGWADESGTGFSLVLTLGDDTDVDMADVLDFLAFDPRTRSVVLYLESVRDARSFMSGLRLLASSKPVIVLKGHRHDEVRRLALTHSGALVGASAVYEAALRRAGAIQIQIFPQIEIAARYLAHRAGHVGRRLAVVSQGKGPAVLASDHAWSHGLRLTGPSESVMQRLSALGADAGNPMDITPLAPGALGAVASVLCEDPVIDALLVILTPHRGADVQAQVDALLAVVPSIGKPIFACVMGGARLKEAARRLDLAGIPVFESPEAAVNAHAMLATFHQNQQLLLQVPRPLSELDRPDLRSARVLLDAAHSADRRLLGEADAKSLLAAFGIPVVETRLARDPDEAVGLAASIGYPVVMKVLSPDILHKSEVGGVALDVRDEDEVRRQFSLILEAVAQVEPHARIEGVTIQAMHRTRHGRELYVGVFRDPLWGPVIAFGAGGTRIELMHDASLEFAPLNRFLVRRMIERTRVSTTLEARHGIPGVDMEAIERVLLRVSEIVCELPDVLEIDINPLMADEYGVVAVDARIVVERPVSGLRRYGHLAIEPYPAHYERLYVTGKGVPYRIRPIQPEDAQGLQSFMRELSPQARYFRFVSTLSELPPRMLVRFTQIDYAREVALVATRQPPEGPPGDASEKIIGVVRYMLNPDRRSCEFAVVVGDGWQGQGLGSTMMRLIVEIARERGLAEVEGYVLSANRPMLGLMKHLGFRIRSDPEDPEMCRVLMPLQ